MNRTEALKHIGSTILIDKGKEGTYFGRLEEVFTPPKKTWSGKVTILGVSEPPDLEHAHSLQELKNATVTVPGSKIKKSEMEWDLSYEASACQAVQQVIDDIHKQVETYNQSAAQWREIGSQFGAMDVEKTPTEENTPLPDEPYVYYRVRQSKESVYLEEEINRETLELEGCPFEFEIQYKGKWIAASYAYALTFEDKKGKKHQVKEYDWVRIHTNQFDPFTILLNELEQPARESFMRDLQAFGFTTKHMVDCHNRLLYELLQAEGMASFKGVNFITFKKTGKTLFVQHHYERTLYEDQPDFVYDRFECTTDEGKRRIATYTNAYTKGH
ncbi:DUF2777 family protein [Alteribacillus iranensis]|uniref:DUF2777 family protein n=1 Tax=Alteribacillus iranensis TaxID=930128 RepID=A0A1I1ZUI3_9BACI|nr:DUF2777 family protein [Alteribacillus iranensis]SFE35444.1 Protein of unknown function [Alteribacillus iranensis]